VKGQIAMKHYLLAGAAALALVFSAGCAHDAQGNLDPVQTTYNAGQVEVEILNFGAALTSAPKELCGPVLALNDGYFAWEKIVTDPSFKNDGALQTSLHHLSDLLAAAVQAALHLGFSLLAPKPHFNLTQHDWDALNGQINAGLAKLHC
jgi:hypothetical protein